MATLAALCKYGRHDCVWHDLQLDSTNNKSNKSNKSNCGNKTQQPWAATVVVPCCCCHFHCHCYCHCDCDCLVSIAATSLLLFHAISTAVRQQDYLCISPQQRQRWRHRERSRARSRRPGGVFQARFQIVPSPSRARRHGYGCRPCALRVYVCVCAAWTQLNVLPTARMWHGRGHVRGQLTRGRQ